MEQNDKMIGLLEGITNSLGKVEKRLDAMDKRFDGIDQRLDAMDKRFDGIDRRLDAMDKRFDGIDQRLDAMDKRFDGIDQRLDKVEHKLDMQSETLKEHSQILHALQTGQEYLKAEIDGMKISNAHEFGALKKSLSDHSTKLDLVHEETWENKVDIRRIKKTMGME